jgi:hypothetical protein
MTRIERIAPFLNNLSDEEFDEFLSAASYAASTGTVYETLPASEKDNISAAMTRLDSGRGVSIEDVKARMAARLKSLDA